MKVHRSDHLSLEKTPFLKQMSLVESLVCECNNKQYFSRYSLNAHKRTKGHQAWENEVNLKNSKCREKEYENEVHVLKYEKTQLLHRIKQLESILYDHFQFVG
jgi:hypothetical protein